MGEVTNQVVLTESERNDDAYGAFQSGRVRLAMWSGLGVVARATRADGTWMSRLILLNGPPGIGKSTLARRYVSEHPLSLLVDIDSIRTAMGGWETHTESMLLARQVAVAMAETQLRAGHDVIIPQLNSEVGMIEFLARPSTTTGADLREVVLLSADDLLSRVEARQAELEASGAAHPLRAARLDRASLASTVDRLRALVAARPQTAVIYTTAGAVDDAYRSFCAALEPAG